MMHLKKRLAGEGWSPPAKASKSSRLPMANRLLFRWVDFLHRFQLFSPAEQVLKWDNSSNMTCLVKCYFSRQWAKGVSRSNYREARTCHSFRWKLETLTWKKCDYIWQLGTLTWKKCDNIWNNEQPLFNLRRTTCCIDLVTFVITDLYLRGISLCKPLSQGFASHKDSHFISPRIDTQ